MQDKLKQFVESHRDECEIYQPREHLWDGVEERMQHKRRSALWQQLAIAASILLLVTCGTWIFIANRSALPVAVTAPELHSPIKGAEVQFAAIMQLKDAELEKYCRPQPELCREFESDMAMLNKAYYQLKNEYAASASKETILQAMMTNLQMQMQLINRQLQIMESVKRKKTELKII